jgi:hypothetical protein
VLKIESDRIGRRRWADPHPVQVRDLCAELGLTREGEPDHHRNLDLGHHHSRWKGRQLRPADHLIDTGIEVGISDAGEQGVIENPPKTVDPETQADSTFLATLTGRIGVVFVGLEPGADHRPVLRGEIRGWHVGGCCRLYRRVSRRANSGGRHRR